MKSTGIVRRLDMLGRIVLPVELRRYLSIEIKEPLEIYIKGETIIIEKHKLKCIYCGSSEKVERFKNKNICESCKMDLQSK